MASLKGQCSTACKGDKRSCWHMDCKILRRFSSGKFLIENTHGYVRAAVPAELFFARSEESTYKQYNLTADELDLEAEIDREGIRPYSENSLTIAGKLQNSFRVSLR